ncbi:lipopolysaccharide biosynthesis protein [Listeria grandensis]|uniref:Lipopolysaccharide biosynthesis protein n=1 Tax=Listeria grandensis TaxID=1494963 RepID=A0A7X0Y3D0_9LIST|nr:lipopolysaccharide biosynthesis protein [Listeria grandensis]MBC1935869.1 lipopolysaccharide biosynthesis protein [Listeria grandensis]
MNFRKIVITLFSGNVVAQLLMIGFSPILLRMYSENQMGEYAAYTTVIVIMVKVAGLSLEKAIPLEQSKKKVHQLVQLNIIIVWLVSLILLIIYIIFDISLLNIIGISPNFISAVLLSLGIGVTSMIQVYNYQNMAFEQYKTLSMTKTMQYGTTGIVQIVLALIQNIRSIGLLMGDVIGKFVSVIILYYVSHKTVGENVKLTWRATLHILQKYRNFIFFSAPAGLINTLSLQVPLLFVISIFSTTDGGQYALVQRAIAVPISLLSISLSQFFYSFAAKEIAVNPGKVYQMYKKMTIKLAVYSIIPIFLLVLIAPSTFMIVFGQNWFVAGQITQYLSLMFFTQITFGATSQILYIIKKQKLQMFLECLKLFSIILVFISLQQNFLQTMFYYGCVVGIFNFIVWVIGKRYLEKTQVESES